MMDKKTKEAFIKLAEECNGASKALRSMSDAAVKAAMWTEPKVKKDDLSKFVTQVVNTPLTPERDLKKLIETFNTAPIFESRDELERLFRGESLYPQMKMGNMSTQDALDTWADFRSSIIIDHPILSKDFITVKKGEAQMSIYDKIFKRNDGDAIATAEIEEWIWIDGYKGTNNDMICRDYQFKLGEIYEIPKDTDIEVCVSGFHFCRYLHHVFQYYSIGNGNRFFKVKALVRKRDCDRYAEKYAAKAIIFTEELSGEHVLQSSGVDMTDWTDEDKDNALKESIRWVEERVLLRRLTDLGYSQPFAQYLIAYPQHREFVSRALAIGAEKDLSMDVKVMFILCGNDGGRRR